jgi:hypothetical protein
MAAMGWDGVAEVRRDGGDWRRAAQLAVVSVSSGSINSQQGGSLQKMCCGDGRWLFLRRIGTTQLHSRVDQMWPLGRGLEGLLLQVALA